MSKRLERLSKWIEANPYKIYADYRDCISDDQAQMLIAGEFQAFDESMWEWENHCSEFVEWSDWESEFASEAGHDEWDVMPEWLQEWALDLRFTDCSDLIETSIRQWSGHVIAWPIKRNGEYILFPCQWYQDKVENKKRRNYMRQTCGFKLNCEASYDDTRLTVLGTLDLLAIYKAQKAPTYVTIDKHDFTLGHEPWNGAGEGYYDSYYHSDKPRRYKAKFYVDGSNPGYGVDSIFGLTGSCWRNELTID
jgi:hypothetical protein